MQRRTSAGRAFASHARRPRRTSPTHRLPRSPSVVTRSAPLPSITSRKSSTFALITLATAAPRADQNLFGFGRRSRQNFAHHLNASHERSSMVLVFRFAASTMSASGTSRVRALWSAASASAAKRASKIWTLCCVASEKSPCGSRMRRHRGLVQVEHRCDLLGVLADLVPRAGPAQSRRLLSPASA